MTEWENLQKIMPPVTDCDGSVDWDRMSESWGREFPPDYQQFISLYGPGTIQNYLVIPLPEYKDGPLISPHSGMAQETKNAEAAWERDEKTPSLEGSHPNLIAWGVDASSDLLCWDASGNSPSIWPVLVRKRGDGLWRRYDCGMVEFLVSTLGGDFDECPLGDLSLWGKPSVLYLTKHEQHRLLAAGLDPWTGKPDPYVRMFGT